VFFLPAFASASDLSGKTADGCTYRIINGQYLTSCADKSSAAQGSQDEVSTVAARPVGSYGSVPVRSNPNAPVPTPAPVVREWKAAPPTIQSSIERDELEEPKRKPLERTYLGVTVGATTIAESNAGATTGFGLNIGTTFDEHYGAELGYGYVSQDLFLDLDSRGQGQVDPLDPRQTNDAVLKSHLITAEVQGCFTNSRSRLRPFLGLGLGWKSSSLEEKTGPLYEPSYQKLDASLNQTSLGGLGSAGAKLRLGKAILVGVAFKYFLPFMRQKARLSDETPVLTPAPARLTDADSALTGSSQYQLSGGLNYAF
jgi:hypothetical protein